MTIKIPPKYYKTVRSAILLIQNAPSASHYRLVSLPGFDLQLRILPGSGVPHDNRLEQQHRLPMVGRQLVAAETHRPVLLGRNLQHEIRQQHRQQHQITHNEFEG
jgi:hypothetical protein